MTDKLPELQHPTKGEVSTAPNNVVAATTTLAHGAIGECAAFLTDVQQYAAQAQDANTAVQNDHIALGVLSALLQAQLQIATAFNAPQAALDQAHATAQQMQTILTDLQSWNTKAASNASSASQVGSSAATANCPNLAEIQKAAAQAQDAASAADSAYTNAGLFDLVVISANAMTHPGPQTGTPVVTPPPPPPPSFSLSASIEHGPLGIPVALDVKLTETDTQNLLAALASQDGGTAQGAFISAVINIGTSIAAGLISGGGVTVAAFIGAVVKMAFQLQGVLIAAVITRADSANKQGVTIHFSLAAAGVALSGLSFGAGALTAGAVVLGAENNLRNEQSTLGGNLTDLFWITGN